MLLIISGEGAEGGATPAEGEAGDGTAPAEAAPEGEAAEGQETEPSGEGQEQEVRIIANNTYTATQKWEFSVLLPDFTC